MLNEKKKLKLVNFDYLVKIDEITDTDIETFKQSIQPELIKDFEALPRDKQLMFTFLSGLSTSEIKQLVECQELPGYLLGFHNIKMQLISLESITNDSRYLDLINEIDEIEEV